MKKVLQISLILVMLLGATNFLQANSFVSAGKALGTTITLQLGNTVALLNGKEYILEVPPILKSGRTLVPVRFIAEALGAEVSWEAAEKKITIKDSDRVITLWVDKIMALIDGLMTELDIPPLIIEGRTMIPLRFVAEALEAEVEWLPLRKTVEIKREAKGKVVGLLLVGGVNLSKRELYLVKDFSFVRVIGLDTAIIEGKADRLEKIPLKIPVVFWGNIEGEVLRVRRMLVGAVEIPPYVEEIIEGESFQVDIKGLSLRITKKSKEQVVITVHNNTEIFLNGKKATLGEIKKGFDLKIVVHREPSRLLAITIIATRKP